jgi:FAD/FMN-containing dehydrogenase
MSQFDSLRSSFRGTLLETGDASYDDARRVHNGLIDKRPALIAQCRSAADVAAAIKIARTTGLPVSIRGGGHNVAGRAVVDDGVMIDLSQMRDVKVDPKARVAIVEGGATWAEVNRATQEHGLATTGGVISSTGVAGLTLGGGLGWLMGLHGMAVDNLIAAELVTADGRVLNVNEQEYPDLFWAIRGGGGNFGVATKLTFRLHLVGQIVGGLAAHPLDPAGEMLRFYRATTQTAPDELTVFGGLVHAPDGSGAKLGAMVVFHPDVESGMRDVAPIKAFGPPVMDAVGPMSYEQINTMLDAGFPKGALNYWKSSFLSELSDAAIETLVRQFRECPAPMGAILLEHFHGAVTRVNVSDTAFPHRHKGYNLVIIAQWLDSAQTDECIAWARGTYEAMRPFMAEGRYMNYIADDETSDVGNAAYGANYARLREIKAKYDPTNLFQLNQNIKPSTPAVRSVGGVSATQLETPPLPA